MALKERVLPWLKQILLGLLAGGPILLLLISLLGYVVTRYAAMPFAASLRPAPTGQTEEIPAPQPAPEPVTTETQKEAAEADKAEAEETEKAETGEKEEKTAKAPPPKPVRQTPQRRQVQHPRPSPKQDTLARVARDTRISSDPEPKPAPKPPPPTLQPIRGDGDKKGSEADEDKLLWGNYEE